MPKVPVDSIPRAHPNIRVKDWLAPLVLRLLLADTYSDGAKEVKFSVRPRNGKETADTCEFQWSAMKEEWERVQKTYQAPVLTEFATLALACASVEHFAQMEVTEVTRRGERADYWLGDRELLLEVSGQQDGDVEALHEEKAQQLRDNPYAMDGFVCVASYRAGAARFWYHPYAE